jgi:hypothetical protein
MRLSPSLTIETIKPNTVAPWFTIRVRMHRVPRRQKPRPLAFAINWHKDEGHFGRGIGEFREHYPECVEDLREVLLSVMGRYPEPDGWRDAGLWRAKEPWPEPKAGSIRN